MHGFSAGETHAIWGVLGVAVLGLAYAGYLVREILAADKGTAKMQEVWGYINVGANTYLRKQMRAILSLVGFIVVLLFLSVFFSGLTAEAQHEGFSQLQIALGRSGSFLTGALFSALVGFIGMNMAVQGNVRVAAAARFGFKESLKIAYRSGAITGMLTDGLGLLGGTIIFIIFGTAAPDALLGFGLGGTLLAMFMRVGGGIYTKAADVGADLVGKVEAGMPEDDPRNAAVIADLVGDNVGDCAGMAADIFESYEVTIVSSLILGLAVSALPGEMGSVKWIVFPLLVRAIGVVSSIIGTYFVRAQNSVHETMKAINKGFIISAAISITGFGFVSWKYMHDWRPFAATACGVVLAVVIDLITAYFTATASDPVKEVTHSTQTGSATTILTGLASGMESSVWAVLVICAAIMASVLIYAGVGGEHNFTYILYSVSLCGIGMLTLTGNNISMDAFGPIVDNANGIGEMAHLDDKARAILTEFDAVGNTTKAITKGVAIGSAVIAAVSLFGSFVVDVMKVDPTFVGTINVVMPKVFVGLLIGGSLPFFFSAVMIRSVSRAAGLIVNEVRRQLKLPGVMEGKVPPDYAQAVDICTGAAQRELIPLGLVAICTPVLVAFTLQVEALGAFLAGVILSGQLLAVFMANAGGAWDNAKKMIEDGYYGGKRSEAHKASVVGDTVGDPLKDTSGPALNPMIKVINIVSLILAPIVVRFKEMTPGVIAIIAVASLALFWAVAQNHKHRKAVAVTVKK